MKKTQELPAYLRAAIAEEQSIHLPTLVRETVAYFRGDPAFKDAFFEEHIYARAYTIATQICAQSRVMVTHEAPAEGDAPAPPPARSKWLARLEHAGGAYLRLGDMDKATLTLAAEERIARGKAEMHIGGLWQKLAAQLPEGKTVKEVFSEGQIDLWARSLELNYRVSIPVPKQMRPKQDKAAD